MIRKIHAPFLAAIAMFMCAGSAQAAQLAINGGFETGDFTGWTQFPQSGTQTITTMNPSSGTYAVNLNASSPGGAPIDNVIKQANVGVGMVAPGQEFTISFDMRGATEAGGVVFAEFFSELDGGGISAGSILGGGPIFANADWTTYVFTAIAGPDVSGGVTLQLKAGCGAVVGCVADVYFDNISITTVPVPAAFWLFGSALGLMGWLKRRGA